MSVKFNTWYENEEEGKKEEGEDEKKLTMTQAELNKMMADNRKKLTSQNAELIGQLETLRDERNRSTESRDELETRIEQLQEQTLTKEELAKRTATKQAKEHQKTVDGLTTESDKWKGLYTGSTITGALQKAAVEGKALHPEQLVAMLERDTHLVEVLDAAGQGTNVYAPVIKFKDTDEDGKNVTLELSPEAVVKRMKEVPQKHGNLFERTDTGGLGGTGSAGGSGAGSGPSLEELKNDPVKFAKWRKENPNLDYTKLRT